MHGLGHLMTSAGEGEFGNIAANPVRQRVTFPNPVKARYFRFTATRAAHSDPYAIGVVIEDLVENRVYYVTGDTLYNSRIFDSLPDTGRNIDVLFLPINGVGNNMNMTDAARFAKKTHAMTVVPYHFGMFDELDPKDFECRNKVIPTAWEEIEV